MAWEVWGMDERYYHTVFAPPRYAYVIQGDGSTTTASLQVTFYWYNNTILDRLDLTLIRLDTKYYYMSNSQY